LLHTIEKSIDALNIYPVHSIALLIYQTGKGFMT